jgi:hypothetical protein
MIYHLTYFIIRHIFCLMVDLVIYDELVIFFLGMIHYLYFYYVMMFYSMFLYNIH